MSKQSKEEKVRRATELAETFKSELRALGFSTAGIVNLSEPGETACLMMSVVSINPSQTITSPFAAIALAATEPSPAVHQHVVALVRHQLGPAPAPAESN